MKYWMLTIDALDGILTDTLANKEIAYSCKAADQVQQGDLLLGYIATPVSQVRMMFSASQNGTADTIFMEKNLDFAPGCTVVEELYQKILAASSAGEKCIEIS